MSDMPLVSIIVPCYNGERLVHRFMDSLLRQTYSNLELIFVNDGSTDGTEQVVLGYEPALEEKGIRFRYIYQENAGQAAAVDRGLKEFHGAYLMCSDSDDWLSDDCVEKKVAYLEANPDKMFVLGKAAFVDEAHPDKILRLLQRRNTASGWLFDDLLFEGDAYYAPGCYLMRSKEFVQTHHGPRIYVGQGGQNWQLLLPMAYRYECGFLDDIVYYIVVHQDSHSRVGKTYEQILQRTYEHEDILFNVISDIDMTEEERAKYLKALRIKYLRVRLHLARVEEKPDVVVEQYQMLRQETSPDLMARLDYIRAKYPVVEGMIRVARIPWRLIVKLRGY